MNWGRPLGKFALNFCAQISTILNPGKAQCLLGHGAHGIAHVVYANQSCPIQESLERSCPRLNQHSCLEC